ncbi:MAG: AMP-binding protein, partial [Symploca sp. SIO2D2]|nr:AMP-binding protein [Symploca sp. SIO2D2]
MKDESIERICNLSPMQEGILFTHIYDPSSDAYIVQMAMELVGDGDLSNLVESFQVLIQRHEVLRSAFVWEQLDQPYCVILKERKADVVQVDVSDLPPDSQEEAVRKFIKEDRDRGFKLDSDLLMRLSALKLSSDRYKILFTYHHIIIDGWCMGTVFHDLIENTNRLREGLQLLPKPEYSYRDYLAWLKKQNRETALSYWSEYLRDCPDSTSLPYVDVSRYGYSRRERSLDLTREESLGLEKIGRDEELTSNTLLQCVWGLLVQRYSNRSTVCFGNVVSGRPADVLGVGSMVGVFINTIPLIFSSDCSMTFLELAKKIQSDFRKGETHGYVSLADILKRSESGGDLFDHLFVYENFPTSDGMSDGTAEAQSGFRIENIEASEQSSYDLNVKVGPGERIKVLFDYNGERIKEEFIELMVDHFKGVVQQILANPNRKVDEIDILTPGEKRRFIEEYNATQADYPADLLLHEGFEKQVRLTPDAPAVRYEEEWLTYAELDRRANRIADALLSDYDLAPGEFVGVRLPRSFEMVETVFGVLKAGAAFLPLDIEYPAQRSLSMLESAGVRLLVEYEAGDAIGFQGDIFDVRTLEGREFPSSVAGHERRASDVAYAIYTSGSTGQPKAALMEHGGVVNTIVDVNDRFSVGQDDVALGISSLSFDLSIYDIFGSLACGASVGIVPEADRRDPSR